MKPAIGESSGCAASLRLRAVILQHLVEVGPGLLPVPLLHVEVPEPPVLAADLPEVLRPLGEPQGPIARSEGLLEVAQDQPAVTLPSDDDRHLHQRVALVLESLAHRIDGGPGLAGQPQRPQALGGREVQHRLMVLGQGLVGLLLQLLPRGPVEPAQRAEVRRVEPQPVPRIPGRV